MTSLSTDRPIVDPKDDLFGHAPFAKKLAESICSYQGTDGLVLALYGPWGSGKSTVLGYVSHYIDHHPEENRPVVVSFNPWWFSGQEHLARAFLGQLQAVLPKKSEKFKKLADLFGDLAEGVGGVIDLSGITAGSAAAVGKSIAKLLKQEPKDVPALKAEISKILTEAKTRILVVIDDIDRLTPDETRQLFTVIKALADFPNVVYLLALDRDVAAQAISQQSGLPGERYLEKIIQVPFELPPVDRVALRAAFFQRLGEVLGEIPEGTFDHSYWMNVYYDGIDALIQVPRDVVRFTNTLAVTYPAVRGEVNTVDFIALEALRVFLPNVYDVVRKNPDRFSGHSRDINDSNTDKGREAFHAEWRNSVREELREDLKSLLGRIFPKTGSTIYGSDWLSRWRRDLRACHPDIFPIFFRLTVPQGNISRSEIAALLSLAGSPIEFGQVLIQSKAERRPDGIPKSRALLERLTDHVQRDISEEHISTVIQALLDVGDALIEPSDELDMFDFGNVSRASHLVYRLLKRVPQDQRADNLEGAIRSGNAPVVQSWILKLLVTEISPTSESSESGLLPADEVERLKSFFVEKLISMSNAHVFINHPKLLQLLATWRSWGNEEEVRAWCEQAVTTDEGLLTLIPKFLSHTKSHSVGDWYVHRSPRLDPRELEVYLDIEPLAERLKKLAEREAVPDEAKESVAQFLKEFEIIKANRP